MSRTSIALFFASVGCSASEPSIAATDTGTTEAAPTDGSSGGVCEIPDVANTLVGQFVGGPSSGEPTWTAKAVYRIDRAKDPTHPQILFLSNPIDCADLVHTGFDGSIGATRMLFLELGSTAPGTYSARSTVPPTSGASYIYQWSSHVEPDPPNPTQRARTGYVTITAFDATTANGTFFADFAGDAGWSVQMCGRFEAKPCAVDW